MKEFNSVWKPIFWYLWSSLSLELTQIWQSYYTLPHCVTKISKHLLIINLLFMMIIELLL